MDLRHTSDTEQCCSGHVHAVREKPKSSLWVLTKHSSQWHLTNHEVKLR